MINSNHHSHLHQGLDQVIGLDTHALGQLANTDGFGDFDDTFNSLGDRNLCLLGFRSHFFTILFLAFIDGVEDPLSFFNDLVFARLQFLFLCCRRATFFTPGFGIVGISADRTLAANLATIFCSRR